MYFFKMCERICDFRAEKVLVWDAQKIYVDWFYW